MSTSLLRLQSTPALRPHSEQKPLKVSDLLIERICHAYSSEDARREGICYWPDPLPTPDTTLTPDPLVLFPEAQHSHLTTPLPLIPLSVEEVVARRTASLQKPSLQIPLGLVDRPETQLRDTLLLDLHGSGGPLSGGPLLILGTQQSGKGTALQILLLWLSARYLPSQFRCAVIDPQYDLDAFQHLPHLYDDEGHSLWTAGSTDAQVIEVLQHFTAFFRKRRLLHPDLHWHDDTLSRLWSLGSDVPLVLLIVSNYQRFIERGYVLKALQEVTSSITDSSALGAYTVVTSTETGVPHLPPDLLNTASTKICLFINDAQRPAILGQSYPMDPIPGRGLLLTRDRKLHQVQLALPTQGANATERYELLNHALQVCANT